MAARRGKHLHKEGRELLLNVFDYFTREKERGGPLQSVLAVQRRTSEALQVSTSAVERVLHSKRNNMDLETPPRKRAKPKCEDIPDYLKHRIRTMIYTMYENKEVVTLDSLLKKMEVNGINNIGRTTLSKLLKHLGFKYKRADNRRSLCERSDVVTKRNTFLRRYIENLNCSSPLPFVFLAETWVFAKSMSKFTRQDDSAKSVQNTKKSSDGKRYVIVHAGNSNGFIENASLIFSTKNKSMDYQDNMTSTLFEKWFEEHVLKMLDEPSIIILDNASCHTRKLEKYPNSSWKKEEIVQWLKEKNISFSRELVKAELLQLVSGHKTKCTYVVDNLANSYGHQVLRLLPYHCQFNPIELVWDIAKTAYNNNIIKTSGTENDVLQTWENSLAKVTPEVWRKCINHTETIIRDIYEKEKIIDDVRPLIFTVNTASDEDSDTENEMDNNDSDF